MGPGCRTRGEKVSHWPLISSTTSWPRQLKIHSSHFKGNGRWFILEPFWMSITQEYRLKLSHFLGSRAKPVLALGFVEASEWFARLVDSRKDLSVWRCCFRHRDGQGVCTQVPRLAQGKVRNVPNSLQAWHLDRSCGMHTSLLCLCFTL